MGRYSTVKGRLKRYGNEPMEYVRRLMGWSTRRRQRREKGMLRQKRATRVGRNQLCRVLKMLYISQNSCVVSRFRCHDDAKLKWPTQRRRVVVVQLPS